MLHQFKLSKIEFIGYILVMFSFFLPIKWNALSLVTLGLIVLIKIFKQEHNFKSYQGLIIYPIFFGYLVIGLLYTENLKMGLSLLERNLSLLFAPIVTIGVQQFSIKQRALLFHVFIAASTLAGLTCLGIASHYYLQNETIYNQSQSDHFIYNHFMHQLLSEPIKMHAIYFSFYLAFANLVILNQFIQFKKSLTLSKKTIYAFVFAFNCVMLYLLKSSNFAFFFPLACIFLFVYHNRTALVASKKTQLIFILLFSIATIFMYKGVMAKIENFSMEYELSDNQFSPIKMRLAMWECTWSVISENLYFGTGTGDGHDELIKSYTTHNFHVGLDDSFNSHNMYLQFWMSNGIPALLLFITILITLIIKAFKEKNMVFLLFVVLFACFSITEATMLTQRGIVFFLFFSSVFYWSPNFWNQEIK